MNTLLLLSLLTAPGFTVKTVGSAASATQADATKGRHGDGGHKDGHKKDEEDEEDCRVAYEDPGSL